MMAFADQQRQLAKLPPVKGVVGVNILHIPDEVTPAIRNMMHHELTLAEFAQELDLPLDQARQVGATLVEKGYLINQSQPDSANSTYRVHFARKRSQSIAVDF
jgi:hypothetical protein